MPLLPTARSCRDDDDDDDDDGGGRDASRLRRSTLTLLDGRCRPRTLVPNVVFFTCIRRFRPCC